MKKNLLSLCVLLLAGCAAVAPISFINQGIWPSATKDKVYSACLTALQLEGLSIHPLGTSKESGLIIAEQDPWLLSPAIEGHYRLQIMVSEVQDGKIMVDVKVKASYKDISGDDMPIITPTAFKNKVNNKVAADLENVFSQMEALVGKAEYYKRTTLSWN